MTGAPVQAAAIAPDGASGSSWATVSLSRGLPHRLWDPKHHVEPGPTLVST